MKNIDVIKIVSEIENYHIPEARRELAEFINSMNGKSFNSDEIIQKIISPMIAISDKQNKLFTVGLISRVVQELEKET